MSTFRWTLASILFDQLEVQVQASMLITPSSEQALTEWMREHLSVAVHPHDDRDSLAGLEHAILETLDPPLNLDHMPLDRRCATRSRSCAGGSAGSPEETPPPSGPLMWPS